MPPRRGSTCVQLGAALGLAIFSAIATARTNDLLAGHTPQADALTSGYQRALLACSILVLAAAVIALRATNTRGEPQEPAHEAVAATHDLIPVPEPSD